MWDDGGNRPWGQKLTLVEVGLVEIVRSGNVHVVQTGDLSSIVAHWPKSQSIWSSCSIGDQGRGSTHIAMAAEVLEQLDLAQGALGENLLAEDICDFLDGNTLVGLVIDGSTI